MKKENKWKLWSYWAGIVIVVGTHIYMLFAGLPSNQMAPHAILNLVGAGLFAFAWYK